MKKNLGVGREVDVYSRTELDESEMFVDRGLFSFVGVGDYTACHSACHLSDRDFLTVRTADADSGALVFGRGFGKIG